MSLLAFQSLSSVVQLYWVLRHGTYLAQRWDEGVGVVNLYHCAGDGRGFFAEVGIDEARDRLVVLSSFSNSGPLEEYARRVRLPVM